MTKKPLKVYRTAKDIVIPAGSEVTVEEQRTSKYVTPHASVLIEVDPDNTAEWLMDLDEAIETGLVEEVP
jgi:hypothetical protein